MSENGSEAGHETTDSLAAWRQGDFTWDYAGFAFLSQSGRIVEENDAEYQDDQRETVGVAVISQTCDIEREPSVVPYVTVCPLVRLKESIFGLVEKRRMPRMGFLPALEDKNVAVDFSRTMSVEKELLKSWTRNVGCENEEQQTQFARMIETCFGRFPFPNDLGKSLEKFRDKVYDKHNREQSPFGQALNYLRELRVTWVDDDPSDLEIKVTFIGILRTEKGGRYGILGMSKEEVDELKVKIEEAISAEIVKIDWIEPYRSGEPKILLTTLRKMFVTEYQNSHALDVNSLSYD